MTSFFNRETRSNTNKESFVYLTYSFLVPVMFVVPCARRPEGAGTPSNDNNEKQETTGYIHDFLFLGQAAW